jgi:hypothetical protein
MQADPTACHSLIGSLAALLPSHGAAPTGLRGRPVRCRSATMTRVVVPVPVDPGMQDILWSSWMLACPSRSLMLLAGSRCPEQWRRRCPMSWLGLGDG